MQVFQLPNFPGEEGARADGAAPIELLVPALFADRIGVRKDRRRSLRAEPQ